MTESTHLLKQYAMQVEVSKEGWQTIQHLVQDNLEKELRRQCAHKGLTVHSINHQHKESMHITEEGTLIETVIVVCSALVYQFSESAEQTLRKIEIDNASSEYFEDDD